MTFVVAADAYDRFMGRYSTVLAPKFAEFAQVESGQRVVDVGCGPGALTGELVARVGEGAVVAVDPSEPFVEAIRERYPEVEVHHASAENLPLPDDAFDAALAQLVVQFMSDPVAGLREMSRVTRVGGVVAASVWDHGGGHGPLSPYWDAVRELDPDAADESYFAGARRGDLSRRFHEAGLRGIEESVLSVEVGHETFEEWWTPFELGVGPAGAHLTGLDERRRSQLRELLRERLPEPPFVIEGRAWATRARA